MRLKQIETFYWAARLGSFVKAAKYLNATQSAVSMRIQELEAQLGVALFNRTQRNATLTSEGQALLSVAEETLSAANRFMRVAADKQAAAGHVKLGVVEVVAETWFPQFLEQLHRRYPQIRLEIEVGLSYMLEAKLASGALDVAFLPCQLAQSGFVHTPLGTETFRWMCSPERVDIPHNVSTDEFMDLPIIATSRELQLRSSALRWIVDNHVSFRAPTICNTFTIAARMALSGLGLALLPLSIYGPCIERRELRIVHCHPEVEPFDLYVVRPVASARLVDRLIEEIALPFGKEARPKPMPAASWANHQIP